MQRRAVRAARAPRQATQTTAERPIEPFDVGRVDITRALRRTDGCRDGCAGALLRASVCQEDAKLSRIQPNSHGLVEIKRRERANLSNLPETHQNAKFLRLIYNSLTTC